ncbi:hypothetical protein GUJ93_ZPchr0015g6820 [Zizania palustris]|uniref:Uncharacterized protein n=1 Tax=Zizania palustris TaxID=103762 RepID=A0A8J5TI45_ZIZPA|nr:hypothetical protein GUJ93_ZPchr0015g6820 [Zizania palustris]
MQLRTKPRPRRAWAQPHACPRIAARCVCNTWPHLCCVPSSPWTPPCDCLHRENRLRCVRGPHPARFSNACNCVLRVDPACTFSAPTQSTHVSSCPLFRCKPVPHVISFFSTRNVPKLRPEHRKSLIFAWTGCYFLQFMAPDPSINTGASSHFLHCSHYPILLSWRRVVSPPGYHHAPSSLCHVPSLCAASL